jgi:ATP-dependent Clp protease ATP-binding subunit ClpX
MHTLFAVSLLLAVIFHILFRRHPGRAPAIAGRTLPDAEDLRANLLGRMTTEEIGPRQHLMPLSATPREMRSPAEFDRPLQVGEGRKPQNPTVAERVAELAAFTPVEIDRRLQALGFRGQAEARRAACVIAYRHVRRLQRLHVEGVRASSLPPRDNLLLVGPTGCGKTHLVELLFREILKVPTVIVDITTFSETGYVGNDASTILSRLVETADGDKAWAACGVACIDEFDKLASSVSSTRFAGAGTTKDVSGFGVQRSLLALFSAETATYAAPEASRGSEPDRVMSLAGLTFIGCGAFSGLGESNRQRRVVGFGSSQAERRLDDGNCFQDTAAFERYGILPELLGRFTRVAAVEQLDREELRAIADKLVTLYTADMQRDGLQLLVSHLQLENLIERALRRGTGARGLRAEFHREVVEAQYARMDARQAR